MKKFGGYLGDNNPRNVFPMAIRPKKHLLSPNRVVSLEMWSVDLRKKRKLTKKLTKLVGVASLALL
jgi:hypothetical protein